MRYMLKSFIGNIGWCYFKAPAPKIELIFKIYSFVKSKIFNFLFAGLTNIKVISCLKTNLIFFAPANATITIIT